MSTTSTQAKQAAEEWLKTSRIWIGEDCKKQELADLTAIIARACAASVEEYRAVLSAALSHPETLTHTVYGHEKGWVRAARVLLARDTQKDTK